MGSIQSVALMKTLFGNKRGGGSHGRVVGGWLSSRRAYHALPVTASLHGASPHSPGGEVPQRPNCLHHSVK